MGYKCKKCGGELIAKETANQWVCSACGTLHSIKAPTAQKKTERSDSLLDALLHKSKPSATEKSAQTAPVKAANSAPKQSAGTAVAATKKYAAEPIQPKTKNELLDALRALKLAMAIAAGKKKKLDATLEACGRKEAELNQAQAAKKASDEWARKEFARSTSVDSSARAWWTALVINLVAMVLISGIIVWWLGAALIADVETKTDYFYLLIPAAVFLGVGGFLWKRTDTYLGCRGQYDYRQAKMGGIKNFFLGAPLTIGIILVVMDISIWISTGELPYTLNIPLLGVVFLAGIFAFHLVAFFICKGVFASIDATRRAVVLSAERPKLQKAYESSEAAYKRDVEQIVKRNAENNKRAKALLEDSRQYVAYMKDTFSFLHVNVWKWVDYLIYFLEIGMASDLKEALTLANNQVNMDEIKWSLSDVKQQLTLFRREASMYCSQVCDQLSRQHQEMLTLQREGFEDLERAYQDAANRQSEQLAAEFSALRETVWNSRTVINTTYDTIYV